MSEVAESRRRLDWRAIVGILLSVAGLYFALRGVDPGTVLHEILSANPFWYVAAVVGTTFPFWVRTWRWKWIIFPVYRETRFHARFSSTCVGFMANNIFPARAGELLRAYMLSRQEPVPVVTSLGSLVVERVFDGITLVVLTFIALAAHSFPTRGGTGQELQHVAGILAIVFAALGGIFVALVIWPTQVVAFIERFVARFLPESFRRPIVDALESLLAALGAIRHPLLVARIVAWSFVLWLLGALSYWFGLMAFGIRVPFLGALFLQSVVSFLVAVPSSPGFFGVFEYGVKVGLVQIWHVNPNRALSYAIGFHIAGYVPITLLGLYYVWRLGLSWKEFGTGEAAVEETVEQQVPEAREIVGAPPTLRADRGGLLDRRQPGNPRNPADRRVRPGSKSPEQTTTTRKESP